MEVVARYRGVEKNGNVPGMLLEVGVGLDELVATLACCSNSGLRRFGKEVGVEEMDEYVEEVDLTCEGKTRCSTTEG